jgi:hypothetical protein
MHERTLQDMFDKTEDCSADESDNSVIRHLLDETNIAKCILSVKGARGSVVG